MFESLFGRSPMSPRSPRAARPRKASLKPSIEALERRELMNAAPIVSISLIYGTEGDVVSYQIVATDADNDPLTYSATGLPNGLSVNAATGLITGTIGYGNATQGNVSWHSFTATADDGTTTGYAYSAWGVTDVPLAQNRWINTNEGTSIAYGIGSTSAPSGTSYSASGLPAGLAFNASTGTVAGRPQYVLNNPSPTSGVQNVTAMVTGSYGGVTDVGTFAFAISDTLRLPSSYAYYTYTEGTSVALGYGASDALGNTLAYSASGLPAGLSIDPATGMIAGKLAFTAVSEGYSGGTSSYQVTVTATDQLGGVDRASFAFLAQDKPLFGSLSTWYGAEGDSIALAAGDPSAAPSLTFSASGLPAGLTINPSTGTIAGVVQYLPNNPSSLGSTYVPAVLTASDGTSGESRTLAFQVTDTNRLPSLSAIASAEGQSASLPNLAATDNAGNSLTYSATGLPPGLSINPSTGQIAGTIAYSATSAGATTNYQPAVTVTDQLGANDARTYWWSVSDVPLAQSGTISGNEGTTVAAYAGPSSPPVGAVFSATGLPEGLSIDPSTGLITGSLQYKLNNPSPAGSSTVTATVTGSVGSAHDVGTLAFAISDANRLPSASSAYAYAEGDSVALNYGASDALGNTLAYSASGLPSGLTIDPSTGMISGRPAFTASSSGTSYYYPTVTVTDQLGGMDRSSLALQIADVPLFGWGSYWYGTEGQSVSLSLAPTAAAGATYTSSNLPAWLTLNASTGLLSGWMQHVPNNPSDGGSWMTPTTTLSVSVTASVTGAGSETRIVPLSVTDSNRLPGGSWRLAYEGDPISWSMAANNALGNSLTYSASGLPAGVTIDAATGLIGGQADYAAASAGATASYAATVSVWDQWGAIDKQTIWLTVSDTPSVSFALSADAVREDAGSKTVTAYLSTATARTVTVQYASSNGTGEGQAQAGLDFTAALGSLTFAPYQTSQTFVLPILDDIWSEPFEALTLTLSGAVGAVIPSATSKQELTIVDDDHAPYAENDPDGSPTPWWPFNENAGTSGTDVALGLQAAFPGPGVSWSSDVPSALGTGSSLLFASAGGSILTDPYDLGNRDFSAALWIKLGTMTQPASLLKQTGLGGETWSLSFDPNTNKLVFFAQAGSRTATLQVTLSSPTSWHHVALTRDAQFNVTTLSIDETWTLYVDGTSVGSVFGSLELALGAASLEIGSEDLEGRIDDVRLWRGLLSGTDVSNLAANTYTAPSAAYSATEDTNYVLADSTILANDGDPDGDTVKVMSWTQPQHGTIKHVGTSFTYTPAANYNGTDWFQYTITDGKGGQASAYVHLNVAAVNDAPTARNDADVTTLNSAKTINVVLNDSDIEGNALTLATVGTPAHGSATIVLGKAVYTPSLGYLGTDSFSYTVTDGNGGTATATATVKVVDAKLQWATSVIDPAGAWDYAPYDWLALQALGTPNTDKYGDIVTAWAPKPLDAATDGLATATLAVGFATADYAVGLRVRETYGNGFVTRIDLRDSGGVWHNSVWTGTDDTPTGAPGDFLAQWPSTSYMVNGARIHVALKNNGEWEEIDAVQLLDVTAETTIPTTLTASNATLTLSEDGSASFAPTLTDIRRVDLSGPSHGYAEMDYRNTPSDLSDDRIVYTPDPDYYGSDSFTYTLTDIWGNTATGTISLSASSVNDAPMLDSDVVYKNAVKNTSLAPTSVTIDLAANGYDVEGSGLTIATAGSAANGSLTYSGGMLTYTPSVGYVGMDSFEYVLSDGQGGSVTGAVKVAVYEQGQWASTLLGSSSQYDPEDGSSDWAASQALNEPEVFEPGDDARAWAPANEDSNTSSNAEWLIVGFATPSQATGVVVRQNLGLGSASQIALQDQWGLWHTVWSGSVAASGNHVGDFIVTFPQTSYQAKAAKITLDISRVAGWDEIDGVRLLTGGSPSSLTTSIVGFNTAPTAGNDWAAGDQNQALSVKPLGNDGDYDGDPLTLTAVSNGASGTVSIHSNGTPTDYSDDYLVYTPTSSGFSGSDSFTYTIGDGHGGTATATVHVQIGNGQWANSAAASSQLVGAAAGQALGVPNVSSYGQSSSAWSPAKADAGTQTLEVRFGTADYASGLVVRETLNNGFVTRIDLLDSSNVWHNSVWTGSDSTAAGQAADMVATWTATAYLVKGARIHVDTDAKAGYEQIDAVRLLTASAVTLPSAPAASGDSASTTEDRPVVVSVLANDGTVSAAVRIEVAQPSHGTAYVDDGGTPNDVTDDRIKYVPDADWNGSDSFSYTLVDPFGRTSTATVSVSVTASNDAPWAMADQALADVNTATTIDVVVNDTDAESNSLTLSTAGNGAHGSVAIVSGRAVYTPASNYAGPDSFLYTISDGNGGTATGRVDVEVYPTGQWASTVLGASSGGDLASKALSAPSVTSPDAWSPSTAGTREFLTLEFATAQQATGILIRQSQGAGTIRAVELLEAGGTVHEIWAGADPSTASGSSDFILRFPETAYSVKSVRVILDGSAGSTDVEAVRLLTGGSYSALSLSRTQKASGGSTSVVSYDSDGNAIEQEIYVDGALVQTTTNTYSSGNLATQTVADALGRQTRKTFDAEGRVLTQTLAYGSGDAATTTTTYDGDGNRISLVDPVGNETTWDYDAKGRETLMTDPHGGEVVKTYDSQSRVASILNRNDKLRTFEYDDAGRLVEEVWYDGPTTGATVVQTLTWDYDDDGLLLQASKTDGTNTYAYAYQYDSAGRVIHVDEPFGVSLDFGYDENGYRNLVKDSLGGEERSVYDAYGQLLVRTLKQNSTSLRIDFTYTPSGQVETQKRYSDLAGSTLVATTTHAYDGKGRLTEIETRNGSNVLIDSFEYTYDAAGQITSRIDTQPGVNGGSPRTTNYDYDDQGQLTEDGSTSHSYDANGNRDGYTYDSIYTNQIEDDGVWTYSYDGEGNVTDKISTSLDLHWHYVYDHANQLAEAKKYDYDASGPEVLLLEVDYVYDVYGNRIEKIVDADGQGSGTAVATKFAVDGWNNTKSTPIGNENWDVWADLDGSSSLTTRYLRGDAVDQLFGRIGSGDPYWHLTDHLGSVRDVVTTSGVESIDYDAFGNILADDAARGRYGWTGRELDAETGLQYNRARYYDSSTGRWISQDPIGFDAGDSNLYRYVSNRASNAMDPSGLEELEISNAAVISNYTMKNGRPFPGKVSYFNHIMWRVLANGSPDPETQAFSYGVLGPESNRVQITFYQVMSEYAQNTLKGKAEPVEFRLTGLTAVPERMQWRDTNGRLVGTTYSPDGAIPQTGTAEFGALKNGVYDKYSTGQSQVKDRKVVPLAHFYISGLWVFRAKGKLYGVSTEGKVRTLQHQPYDKAYADAVDELKGRFGFDYVGGNGHYDQRNIASSRELKTYLKSDINKYLKIVPGSIANAGKDLEKIIKVSDVFQRFAFYDVVSRSTEVISIP